MQAFRKSMMSATVLVAASTMAFTAQAADPGITDTEIKIGNTNPYSGPAAAYSVIGQTIDAFFKSVNDAGGIHGRKINFISVDDGYSPPKTKEQFRRLVEKDKVLFIFQSLGTPTNSAVHRYINKKKVPHLFVATGAAKWGNPSKFPWTLGYQPNYQTAGRLFAEYIVKNKPDGKIGILYQNDDYGKDYVIGMQMALGDKFKKMVVAQQSYETSEPTVASQVVNLRASGANIFYNVSIPKFAAQAIRKVYDMGWKPMHLLNDVSTSIPATLKPAGLKKSIGIVSLVWAMEHSDPQWKDHPEMKAFSAWAKKWYPKANLGNSLHQYGYSVANLMVHVLKKAGKDLSRKSLMAAATSIKDFRVPLLLPGIMANTSATDFYPIEQMQYVRFDGEAWIRFGKIVGGAGS